MTAFLTEKRLLRLQRRPTLPVAVVVRDEFNT